MRSEWEERVVGWARDRNILQDSNPERQLIKLGEEFQELVNAVYDNKQDEVKDAIGDMSVVLAIICAMRDTTLPECQQQAWDTIKHRTGRMVNGIFQKDA